MNIWNTHYEYWKFRARTIRNIHIVVNVEHIASMYIAGIAANVGQKIPHYIASTDGMDGKYPTIMSA